MADIGPRNAALLQQSADSGKSLENIVFRMLERSLGEEDKLSYYLERGECDFVVQRSGVVSEQVQVYWAIDESNRDRELGGLLEASNYTGCDNCRVITFENDGTEEYKGRKFAV